MARSVSESNHKVQIFRKFRLKLKLIGEHVNRVLILSNQRFSRGSEKILNDYWKITRIFSTTTRIMKTCQSIWYCCEHIETERNSMQSIKEPSLINRVRGSLWTVMCQVDCKTSLQHLHKSSKFHFLAHGVSA